MGCARPITTAAAFLQGRCRCAAAPWHIWYCSPPGCVLRKQPVLRQGFNVMAAPDLVPRALSTYGSAIRGYRSRCALDSQTDIHRAAGAGQTRLPWYSRRIRQTLFEAATEGEWQRRFAIAIGNSSDIPGSYSELLASSLFCLCPPGNAACLCLLQGCAVFSAVYVIGRAQIAMLCGSACRPVPSAQRNSRAGDGFSTRLEDAVLHGCLPVIVNDGVLEKFEGAGVQYCTPVDAQKHTLTEVDIFVLL